MGVKFCIGTNPYVNRVPNTDPPKFEGQAGFYFNELIDVMDRFGNLTYIERKSWAECTDDVRRGAADFALVMESYPMPEEDNITQLNMVTSNRITILSGFNQTQPYNAPPDLMVFSKCIISLFVLTVVLATLLYSVKLSLSSAHRVPLTKANYAAYIIRVYLDSCEVIFLAKPLKDHLVRYFFGTFILTWASTALVVFYSSHLNSKQLVFNPPHLIKSYKQIEREGIKPLFTTQMNDWSLIENSSVYDSEYRIKKLIHRYGVNSCRIEVSADPNEMVKYVLKLHQQREVILMNEQIASLSKALMCAMTYNIRANLTFYSHTDEGAANNNLQVVYRSKFTSTEMGKKMYRFMNTFLMSSYIGAKAFDFMKRLSQIFYDAGGVDRIAQAKHEKTCASNYFEIPEPFVDAVDYIIADALLYLMALAPIVLFLEVHFEKSLGRFLNHYNRFDARSSYNQPRRGMERAQWHSSRDKLVLQNAPVHVKRRR